MATQLMQLPEEEYVLPGTRAHNQHEFQIDIAVQKKLAADTNAEIDTLMTLVDEVADHFRMKRLDAISAAVWAKTENEPLYSQEHLEQLRQFTSVVTFTFRWMR